MTRHPLTRDNLSLSACAVLALVLASSWVPAQDSAQDSILPDVQELIAASREATVLGEATTLADGKVLTPRVARPADPLPTWAPTRDWPATRPPQPGRVVPIAWTAKQYAVQPLDDGRIVVGTMDSIVVVDTSSPSDSKTRTISDAGARLIQPNEDGSRLLVTTFVEPHVRILDGQSLEEVSRIEVGPGDITAWWGETSDSILMTREGVDFRSDSENRIFLVASQRNLNTGIETPLEWPATYFAALGSIAPQGLVWAHRTRPYQIDPVPAPLIALDGGKVLGLLTVTSTHADTQPAGGRDGWLYWIRTLQRGGRTGRLFARDIREAESPEFQLNSESTQLVGVSPSGSHVAWIVGDLADPASTELRMATAEELRASDFSDAGTADKIVEDGWRLVLTRLRAAFDQTNAATGATVQGPMVRLAVPVNSTELDAMGEAFELALDEAFPSETTSRFERVDALLDSAEGLLPQEPSVISGIAGLFVREARRREHGTVLLAGATPALSETLSTWSETDGMTHRKVSPFAIARERLEGSARLADAMRTLLQPTAPPIFFVENFGNEVNDNISNFLLGVAGLKEGESDLGAIETALQRESSCDLCALRLAREGADAGRAGAALEGATALVQRRPASAEAFALLSDALFANGGTDEARDAMEWAVTLSPIDADLRYRFGSLLITLGELGEAVETFESIRSLPEYGSYQGRIEARLQLIEGMRGDAAP